MMVDDEKEDARCENIPNVNFVNVCMCDEAPMAAMPV